MAGVNLDTAARLDIICRKGDSFSLAVKFDSDIHDTDPLENEGADNEEGADDVWTLTVKETLDSETTEFSEEGQAFTLTVAEDNKTLNITNSASSMASIDAGLYVYDVQRSTGANDDVTPAVVADITTYLYGTFEVREDVTDNS